MGFGHAHHHGEAGNDAPVDHSDSKRRLRIALYLIGGFMLAEVVGGIVANSLALLADAGHMLTDTLALALALIAFRVSERPATRRHTYGYDRIQVLAAFVNGLVLLALAAWIVFEAVKRILAPQPVIGPIILVIGILGLFVNIAAFLVLHGGDRDNLNLRGATLHVLSDMIGSISAIVAAVVIIVTGWTVADPLLSLLVAGLVAYVAIGLVRRSGHVLLEGTPEDLDIGPLREQLATEVDDVLGVHHVHAWSLTNERRVITLHARIRADADPERVLAGIKAVLVGSYGIEHSTVQLEFARDCVDDGVVSTRPP